MPISILGGGQTLEFALINLAPGSTSWGEAGLNVLKYDVFYSVANSEFFRIRVKWMENPFASGVGALEFSVNDTPVFYDSSIGTTLNQYSHYAIVSDFEEANTYFYVNGAKVNTYPLFLFSANLNGSLTVYSGSGLVLDNVRRSDIARYTGDEYVYVE